MRMGDFGGVCLLKFIHLRASYMFLGVVFEFLKFPKIFLE